MKNKLKKVSLNGITILMSNTSTSNICYRITRTTLHSAIGYHVVIDMFSVGDNKYMGKFKTLDDAINFCNLWDVKDEK